MTTFLIDLLLTAQVIVALLLVLVVLLQRPRSEGLGTAFASGTIETFLGPATGFLVRFTTWMGGLFFVLTLALARTARPSQPPRPRHRWHPLHR